MRITGGNAAGRILSVPKGFDVRPTPDRVRQAIFNSLGERILGAHVLELFAGTGALSLECLSRGAIQATCIEKSHRHAEVLRKNFSSIAIPNATLDVRVQDAFSAISQIATAGQQFDVILADPPYGEKNVDRRSTSFAQQLLDDPHLPALLKENGLLVLGRRDSLTLPDRWRELKLLRHGDTFMRFLAACR
jgi:16S rRNA (guanine966-N2)-methyltransferase